MLCPLCEIPLKPAVVNGQSVLRCGLCRGVSLNKMWFHPGEFEKRPTPGTTVSATTATGLPRRPPPPAPARVLGPPPAPPTASTVPASEAARALALAQVTLMQEQLRQQRRAPGQPASVFKNPGMLVGLPARDARYAATSFPVMTVALMMACALAAVAAPNLSGQWGFLPKAFWRHSGLTFVTSFFWQTGWWSLLTHFWLLWMFGGNVEEHLGRARFIGLLALATAAANLMLLGSAGATPALGAGSAVAAVVAYYALAFSEHRISTLWILGTKSWPVGLWGIGYFLLQLPDAYKQFSSNGMWAGLSPLAGFAMGALIYMWFKPTSEGA